MIQRVTKEHTFIGVNILLKKGKNGTLTIIVHLVIMNVVKDW